MIEQILYDYLSEALDVPVHTERPITPPTRYILIEKVGAECVNHINSAVVTIRSHGTSLLDAASIDAELREKMLYGILERSDVYGVRLNTSTNFTDEDAKKYRYQSLFEITFEEEY
jgi:hypothetical protein